MGMSEWSVSYNHAVTTFPTSLLPFLRKNFTFTPRFQTAATPIVRTIEAYTQPMYVPAAWTQLVHRPLSTHVDLLAWVHVPLL